MTFDEFVSFVCKVAPVHHRAMVKKGFWEHPDITMKEVLIISEVIEAVEAVRAVPKKLSDTIVFEARLESLTSSINIDYVPTHAQADVANKYYVECYERYIKDTLQDELAGTFLRLVDTMEGYKEIVRQIPLYEAPVPATFGFFAKHLIQLIVAENYTGALSVLFAYCTEHKINLKWHVEHAMVYNTSRPAKHGKNF